MRTATVSTGRDLAAAREATDVLIQPDVSGIEIRDWAAYDAGRRGRLPRDAGGAGQAAAAGAPHLRRRAQPARTGGCRAPS